MTSTPNLAELKQCLQEAGMYEENMNEDEMRSYYDAIKSSESTAKEEDEHRNIENTSELQITYDVNNDEESDEKISLNDTGDSKKSNGDSVEKEEPILDPLNCSPLKQRLTIIYHTPRYNLPPHVDPKLSKLSIGERAKIISAFHAGILQKFSELHKKSKNFVPWGKAIHFREAFKGWSDRKSDDNSVYDIASIEQDNESTQETYTLRSGRQTKRKVYSEYVDSDTDKKRSKKDEDENDYKPIARRRTTSKLSNQDIMKRSKLFADTAKSPRSEAMFEQLATNEKKRQQDEDKIESFKQNLPQIEEDDDIIPLSQSQEIVDKDIIVTEVKDPIIRRRIPPPIHGRRGIGTKRTIGSVALSDVDKMKPTESSPKRTLQRSVKSDSKPPRASTSLDNKDKSPQRMTKCPICSDFFNTDEVEAHASNCGLATETPVPFESATETSRNMLQCAICDKQMMMTTEYEIHVADCMRRERMK